MVLGGVPYAIAGCSQVLGQTLQPAIPEVSQGATGMLSSYWASATVLVSCSGLVAYGKYFNNIYATAGDSGKTLYFEGANYKLYKTSSADVMFIAKAAGPDNIARPLGDLNRTPVSVSSTGTAGFGMIIYVRYYSPSQKLFPGLYSITGQDLFAGLLSYNNGDPSVNFGYWGTKALDFSFLVMARTCQLYNNAPVKLKKISLSALPVRGSTVDAGTVRLDIGCESSMSSNRISVNMIDMATPWNNSSNLTFTTHATQPSGVTLQLMNAGKLLNLGVSSSNVIGYTPVGTTDISKVLDVRYIRTEDKVIPGAGNAAVSVTVTSD